MNNLPSTEIGVLYIDPSLAWGAPHPPPNQLLQVENPPPSTRAPPSIRHSQSQSRQVAGAGLTGERAACTPTANLLQTEPA
jgi:hypothetical protein